MNTIVEKNINTREESGIMQLTPVFDVAEKRRKKIDQLLSAELYIDSNQLIQGLQEKLRTLYKSPVINIYLLQRGKDGTYYDKATRKKRTLGGDIRTKKEVQNEDIHIPVGSKDSRENTMLQISGVPEIYASEIIAGMRKFRERGAHTLSLIQMYNHDELTGLYNKSFEMKYGIALDREGKNTLYGVAVIDLKKFKQINDSYGHTIGDEALKRFAECMQHVFQRDSERPIRHGGDEFSIVFRFDEGTSTEKQQQITEGGMKRLQDHIDAINNSGGFNLGKLEDNSPILVQLLFRHGISLYFPGDPLRDTFEKVWNKADPPKTKGRDIDGSTSGGISVTI